MATVTLLRTGFSRVISPGVEQAACTITLIRGATTNVLVDTGAPTDRAALEAALGAQDLQADDIRTVVCTHGHADHIGNNNLFPHALIVVSNHVTKGDLLLAHDWQYGPLQLDDDIRVELAPGHTRFHNVVWARTANSIIAVAGDTFAHQDDEAERTAWLAHSELPDDHLATRDRIRKGAGFIVPGHGAMFAVA